MNIIISTLLNRQKLYLKTSMNVLLFMNISVTFTESQPFVTTLITFKNTTPIAIDITQQFEDASHASNSIDAGGSFEVVNFQGKALKSAQLTSTVQDKNGNAYIDGAIEFKIATENEVCTIALEDIPAHEVPAAGAVPAFKMPASQKIIVTLAS